MKSPLTSLARRRTVALSVSAFCLIPTLVSPAARAQPPAGADTLPAAPAQAQQPPAEPGAPAVAPEETRMLIAGTPIRVRLPEAVRSGKVKKGDSIRFLVAEAVRSADGRTILVPAGAQAEGVVRASAGGGRFGQPGQIIVQGERLLLPGGTPVPLRPDGLGSPAARGRGRGLAATGTGFLAGTVVGAGILYGIILSDMTFSSDKDSGLGLLSFVAVVGSGFLGASSIRGGEASLREGTDYTFYVAEDTPIRTVTGAAQGEVAPLALLAGTSRDSRWEWGARPLLAPVRSGRGADPGVAFSVRMRY